MKPNDFVKIAVFENEIEAQIMRAVLTEHDLPHLIRSFHDTAYDGLYQFQMGWGELHSPQALKEEILALLENIRSQGGSSMTKQQAGYAKDFETALAVGRPPNVKALFPNSRALIVSGKFIDRAMLAKGQAIALAANGRSSFVIRGALRAAQRANAALILEIAKSEGGANAYCPINYWNIARTVDAFCNELGITIPVAIHADHYGIKGDADVESAQIEIPSMFDAGITSIAIDASHLPDDQNLLASIKLGPCVPDWASLETEVGEIKGKEGLSTAAEAQFLIQGLNAHDIFPDWIALNNGTTHGIEASGQGIQVALTGEIHEILTPYKVSGAQHGTSGNSSDRLREIAARTRTTKANVATALQMISWGLEVNDYGNAILDDDGHFIKLSDEGMTDEMWAEMVSYAGENKWSGGNFKKLNLPFDNKLLGQSRAVRERMAARVEDFAYNMIANVLNSGDTAPMVISQILAAGSHDAGPKASRIEDPQDWTPARIAAKATELPQDKGPEGDFED